VSTEYINKCKKAVEIQALKRKPEGSYQNGNYTQSILSSGQFHESTGTWLPTEEFWISFVMKELYDKIWNGEDWIKLDK